MRLLARPLLAATLLALPMLVASCSEKPQATDPEKTATVVPAETMKASDSTAVAGDTTKKM